MENILGRNHSSDNIEIQYKYRSSFIELINLIKTVKEVSAKLLTFSLNIFINPPLRTKLQ